MWGSHQTLRSLPLPNVTWHSGTWPYTVTPSIDQTLHLFAKLLPNWTLIPIMTLFPNFGGFHRTLQRVRLANRGRLLLRTPGPVPFGTCICSNVETILSWTCHVYGPFEFRTSLGYSFLLSTNFMTLIPSLTFTELRVVPKGVCNGCGMQAGNAYRSRHLVPSRFWDLLMIQLLRPVFSNLPCLFSTFHLEYPSLLSRFCFRRAISRKVTHDGISYFLL